MSTEHAWTRVLQKPWAQVGLIFLSGIVINELSDQVEITGWLIVVAAAGVLFLMVNGSRSSREGSPSVIAGVEAGNARDIVFVGLLALLIGFVAGVVALLPVFDARVLDLPAGATVYSYEIGAAAFLLLVSCVAAARRRPALLIASFLAASVAGMTLAIMMFEGEKNDASRTYIGWLVALSVPVIIIYSVRDLWRVLRELLIGSSAHTNGTNNGLVNGGGDVEDSDDHAPPGPSPAVPGTGDG